MFAEEGIKNGGAAVTVGALVADRGLYTPENYRIAAIDDNFLVPDEPCDIYTYAGLSPSSLVDYFAK